ncbi:DUF4397 domain-containing protein [Planctomonas psychrotolerans]|uniref:DUF4397 domain-containing protein n=1 Tax=Planctomonas psychrotolerans TaxID=2528712 RepID=UPI001D0D1D57|nr:DUF4397 domain-containing protein [Planctomonas psychrotolerans]
MTRSRHALRTAGAVLLASGMGFALLGAGAATAAPAAPTDSDSGWARVAHLSPDTALVDVQLTALAGGQVIFELAGVGYGAVSEYQQLPAGTYVVSMVPNGAPEGTPPVISESIDVQADRPMTVAALGTNAELETRVYRDDLTLPAPGEARIRVVQASTTADSVDIRTRSGVAVAEGAAFASATDYANVPAGPVELQLSAGGRSSTATLTLPEATVHTLFVLDNADGGLTVTPVFDSAAVGAVPKGGVQTGGGGMRSDRPLVGEDAVVGMLSGAATLGDSARFGR